MKVFGNCLNLTYNKHKSKIVKNRVQNVKEFKGGRQK